VFLLAYQARNWTQPSHQGAVHFGGWSRKSGERQPVSHEMEHLKSAQKKKEAPGCAHPEDRQKKNASMARRMKFSERSRCLEEPVKETS